MNARGTDWGLAALVLALVATGVLGLFGGGRDSAWIFVAHDAAGVALAALVVWKLRRVWRRIVDLGRWDAATIMGLMALGLVLAALLSGWVWSSGGNVAVAGYALLDWHYVVGAMLALLVLAHAVARAKPIRSRDVADRRQFLHATALGAGALGAWWLQRPVSRVLGSPGAGRRFTGSYESGSFAGNAFPSTSWVADRPRELAAAGYRLRVSGQVANPLALAASELGTDDALTATLDCTGGFYSTQRWRGTRLDRLLARAQPHGSARFVRVVSHTGYRWSFPRSEARHLLLATHVGDAPLTHDHGAPVRLVAPGRRGFQWVKWVTHVELHDEHDYGAAASTVWSSLTPEGRGAA